MNKRLVTYMTADALVAYLIADAAAVAFAWKFAERFAQAVAYANAQERTLLEVRVEDLEEWAQHHTSHGVYGRARSAKGDGL